MRCSGVLTGEGMGQVRKAGLVGYTWLQTGEDAVLALMGMINEELAKSGRKAAYGPANHEGAAEIFAEPPFTDPAEAIAAEAEAMWQPALRVIPDTRAPKIDTFTNNRRASIAHRARHGDCS